MSKCPIPQAVSRARVAKGLELVDEDASVLSCLAIEVDRHARDE